MSPSGQYFIDKYHNSGAPVFTKQQRLVTLDVSETRKITPGPGSYRAPSEFGFQETTSLQKASKIAHSRSSVNILSQPKLKPNAEKLSAQIRSVQQVIQNRNRKIV